MQAKIQTVTQRICTLSLTEFEARMLYEVLKRSHETDYCGKDLQEARLGVMKALEDVEVVE